MRKPFVLWIMMLMISAAFPALAAEPPQEPILRLETGAHMAVIWRISVDDAGQYLVSSSEDKTLRLWDARDGRLLKTFRIPIGAGDEGKLNAVAISPDGKMIAAGGWTGWNWDGFAYLYIFDRDTGRLIRRISNLPGLTLHSVFSRDGQYLAVVLSGQNGLRVFRVTDGEEVAKDTDYGALGLGADFDRMGRLVTSCNDGYVRLYDNNFRMVAKEKSPGGEKPYAVAFSPDATKIAVGFGDSTKVAVVSGRDLSFLYSPDIAGVDNGILNSVTWSSDGRYLYAAGGYHKNGQNPIRRWSDAGRGVWQDIFVGADSTIMDIKPRQSGGVFFGIGALDNDDKQIFFVKPVIADYRAIFKEFLISHDGATIRFAYETWGKSPAIFDIALRRLNTSTEILSGLNPPQTHAAGIEIQDWNGTTAPKLNGKPLSLSQHETSFSFSISPDSKKFLLGTNFAIRLFDRQGSQIWEVPVPGVAWGVNISGDGRLAVAAFNDGTIRWYRLVDGRELLAFFPHNDRKSWILWSTGGYYDASPGGEELIGWHINNGKNKAADFFPASRFRATYYRPDIIARILPTGNESEAIRLANEESGRKTQKAELEKILPPVMTIISPQDSETVTRPEVTITYAVRSPSGEPVTGIRAFVDGRPVRQERGLKLVAKGTERDTLKITIPEKDCEISLIAENRFSPSEPATVRILYRGKTNKAEEFVVKPKLYVLAVGVSLYQDKSLTLKFAAKDAKDFSLALEKQKGGLYRDVQVRLLTDAKATRDEVMDGLDWIQKETTAKDVAMVFIAGHGVNDPTGNYYFLPANVHTEKLKRTGVVFSDIKNTLNSLAGKALFFMDTCHSGNVMGSRRAQTDITGLVNELASAENGVVVFASSTGKQYSLEDAAWGNGAFTKALVEGLSGKADYTGKGKITINMLDLYISEKVKELTSGRQTPTTTKPQTIADFPVAVKR